MLRRLALCLIALAILIIAGIGGWLYLKDRSGSNLIPAAVRQQVDFALYFPAGLPVGYKVNQAPALSEGVVVMAVSTPSGSTVYLSQQAAPTGIDYQKFLNEELKRPQEFSTPIGVGYIGGPVGRVLGSVLTAKTWVMANSVMAGNTEMELKEILKSLRQI